MATKFERTTNVGENVDGASQRFQGFKFVGVVDAQGAIADSNLCDVSGYIISVDYVKDGATAWTPVLKNRDGVALPIAGASLSDTTYNIRPNDNSVSGNPESFIFQTGGFYVSGTGTATEGNTVEIVVNMEI